MNEIRDELKTYLGRTKTSISTIAKAIDRSPSAISQWLKNDYTGDNAAIEQAVAGFLVRQEEKTQAPLEGPFALTTQAREILLVLGYVHVHSTLGVVVGPSGNGKTRAITHYASQNAGVTVLTLNPSSCSMSEAIHQLHEQIDPRGTGRGTLGGIVRRVGKKLAGSGRLLIIDEAQYLLHPAIEVLRSLHDDAGVGVAFVGMPRLYHHLVSNTVELFEQIRTRIGIRRQLSPLSLADATAILRAVDPKVPDAVCRRALDVSAACGRSIVHLYHHAAGLARAEGRAVIPDDISVSQSYLYEPRAGQRAAASAPPPATAPAPPSRLADRTGRDAKAGAA